LSRQVRVSTPAGKEPLDRSEPAVAGREQAIAGREQAIAGREQAIAGREQAIAGREQAIAGKVDIGGKGRRRP